MSKQMEKVTLAGMVVTLGIVYGDIGTSPLYVMDAIIGDAGKPSALSAEYIIGAISLIFWTLMIITTLKYVVIAMQADNNKEGGIFALYALVRRQAKWLIYPALIGGAAILADGTLTPAVTVTSAVEGLKNQRIGQFDFGNSQHVVLLVTTGILLMLFLIQRFGTGMIGRAFGPTMMIWFGFLAIGGFINLLAYPGILQALSPYYALKILFSPVNKAGIFILGSVFLATTGAEALYSDMGHVGKKNIYATWPLVCLALCLNYFGQGAWIIHHVQLGDFQRVVSTNPFYEMLAGNWHWFGVLIATLAAIIASQALITGSYTLVSEAIGLKFLPRMAIKHSSNIKNQIYIGAVNWALCAITLGIVWYFGSSKKMEAAYGLAITITMLMTTLLLFEFLRTKVPRLAAGTIAVFFGVIETVFLAASLVKFIHGGYVTLLIMSIILCIMWVWYFGNKRRDHYERESEYVSLLDFRDQLVELSNDDSVPMYATNVVYISKIRDDYRIKRSTLYSILDQEPKRARVYWFVTINETDEPYESNYTVDLMGTKTVVNVQLNLGFRKTPNVGVYLHQIVDYLVAQKAIDPQMPKYTTQKNRQMGNFKFVIINEQPADLSTESQITRWDRLLIAGRLYLQNFTGSPATWYGLQFSNVIQETSPLFIIQKSDQYLVNLKIDHKA